MGQSQHFIVITSVRKTSVQWLSINGEEVPAMKRLLPKVEFY